MQIENNDVITNVNVTLINFANNSFRKSQKKNSLTGNLVGNFDKVLSFQEKDIDRSFYEKNKLILKQSRGAGYWLWKPYFILKVLDTLKDGDFLFYCDSGSYFVNPIDDFIKFGLNTKQDVIPCELNHIEKRWTKRDAFILMDCDSNIYFDTKQRLASFILIRKSQLAVNFVKDWLNYAQDERIITDAENQCGLDNYPEFSEHRHDQSIFSLLTKKYSFNAYRDISQFGNDQKQLYPNCTYAEILNLTRKRNFPFHIVIKKYLSHKKYYLRDFFNSLSK